MHAMHVLFMFFAVFKNLKSLFSEDNVPVHKRFHLESNQNGLNYPIKVAPDSPAYVQKCFIF